jgi:hypothetical protein
MRTYLEKNLSQKRAGVVAQGPEFKSQYQKPNQNKKIPALLTLPLPPPPLRTQILQTGRSYHQ